MNDEIEIKPCVKCGYCCTKGPCGFGKWNEEKTKCVHLTEDTLCGIFDEISGYPGSDVMPAFGAGCCMSLANTVRRAKIKQLLAGRGSPGGIDSVRLLVPRSGIR